MWPMFREQTSNKVRFPRFVIHYVRRYQSQDSTKLQGCMHYPCRAIFWTEHVANGVQSTCKVGKEKKTTYREVDYVFHR